MLKDNPEKKWNEAREQEKVLSLIILNKTAHAIEPLSSTREQEKVAMCSGQVRFDWEREWVSWDRERVELFKNINIGYLKTDEV